jgi:hypothetical protein
MLHIPPVSNNPQLLCNHPSTCTHTEKYFSPCTSVSAVSIIPLLLDIHSAINETCFIGFFSQCLSFPCQYHSTITSHTFEHLPHILYNIFLPGLQFSAVSNITPLLTTHPSMYHQHPKFFSPVLHFSPVSIIPPLLHTHSTFYLPCCIVFFSQHFRFRRSVLFPHCSTLIQSSTNKDLQFFFPVLQYSPLSNI